jgi:hypothetical protein
MSPTRVALLALLAAIATGAAAVPKYRPMPPLGRLIGTADAIVTGTVTATSGDTFTLAVEQYLADEKPDQVVVAKPPRKGEIKRWAPYERGQQLLLALQRPAGAKPGAPWQLAGGAEGELVLDQSYLYLEGFFIRELPVEKHRVAGATIEAQRVDRQQAWRAIVDYGSCLQWDSEPGEPPELFMVCQGPVLLEYKKRSPFHDFLTLTSFGPSGGDNKP